MPHESPCDVENTRIYTGILRVTWAVGTVYSMTKGILMLTATPDTFIVVRSNSLELDTIVQRQHGRVARMLTFRSRRIVMPANDPLRIGA